MSVRLADQALVAFTIYPDDGEPFRLNCDSRDVSLWERTLKGRSLGSLESNPSMTALEELAHMGMRCQGLYEGNLDAFRQSHAIVPINMADERAGGDDVGLDPTRTDQ